MALAFIGQGVNLFLGEPARIGQLARNLLVFGLVAQVFRRGDHGHEHVFAQRGLAQDFNLHAVGSSCESFEVRGDLAIVGELAVRADFKAQEF